jgi:hypothetical protein
VAIRIDRETRGVPTADEPVGPAVLVSARRRSHHPVIIESRVRDVARGDAGGAGGAASRTVWPDARAELAALREQVGNGNLSVGFAVAAEPRMLARVEALERRLAQDPIASIAD